MFIASIIIQSNCNISQFSYQIFNVSALLPDDALKPATPLTNDAINQTLRQFAPFSAPELSWIVNIDKPSMKKPPSSKTA